MQAQATQSDYDTDTANATDIQQAHSQLPVRTNEEINLSVLQRHNPLVGQIVSIAPFAVVYLFSPDSQQWEKSGIEGTLFVCMLTPTIHGDGVMQERYSVVVLNRKGLENFATELLSASDVEITEQYVILQVTADDGTPQIFGLWIFSEPEPASTAQSRIINAQIISECASRAEKSRILSGVAAEPEDEAYESEQEDAEEDEEEEEDQQSRVTNVLPSRDAEIQQAYPISGYSYEQPIQQNQWQYQWTKEQEQHRQAQQQQLDLQMQRQQYQQMQQQNHLQHQQHQQQQYMQQQQQLRQQQFLQHQQHYQTLPPQHGQHHFQQQQHQFSQLPSHQNATLGNMASPRGPPTNAAVLLDLFKSGK